MDARHGRESVSKAIAIWSGLVKAIAKDEILLDMIITTGSPSEAWKNLSGMIDDECNDIAHDKMRQEFEQLTLKVGEEPVRDYIARAKALTIKLEQHGMKINDEERNRRILKGRPDGLSVERRTLSMLSGVKFEDLGEALARIEEDQDEKDAGGNPCTGC